MKQAEKQYNRLVSEKSPYLLQHAGNPVDWYPWGPEAFEKARQEDKPIFLSIGYSTCHWCHVMEHESFEDTEVARLMNEAFVCIKVDREERPEIDSLYMTVCQMLTGSGGWPLTILMTPDRRPFFAGTYFPKEGRFGKMGMLELVPLIREVWATRREEVLNSVQQIGTALQRVSQDAPGEALDESTLRRASQELADRFDARYGGFGKAPKFPNPHSLLFLLRFWKRTGEERSLAMVERTLQAMRQGGIYDQIGLGFHRYATDPQWLVPHFEKMLYDQAMLAMAYIEAYQATGEEGLGRTAQEIFTYVLRDMTAPAGGFYSAEDADSEGVEGKFYLWTEEEIRQVLEGEEADLVLQGFNIERAGNFTDEIARRRTGTNILHRTRSLAEIAADRGIPEESLRDRLEAARQKLFEVREGRAHPHKDDKILTDWNGLMIAALAKGAQAFEEPRYAEAAQRAVVFLLREMRTPAGRLLHRYRDGQAAVPAYADDYAFLLWGLIELYEASWEADHLRVALDLQRDFLEHFWDERNGGFYLTADDHEELLIRQKEIYDGAIPSGNSVAMLNLLRLGRMTASAELEEKAARMGRAFSGNVNRSPSAYTQLMVAVDFAVGPAHEVVIVGSLQAEETKAMVRALRGHFLPHRVVLLRPAEQESPEIVRLAGFLRDLSSIDGKATAYVCRDYRCERPTTEIEKMLELLRVTPPRRGQG
ncbi:MAG: thioredoxin domain-containing protein [Candidatus Tectomicrobia bacterium]|uniref:Thioredoxin domain-containing protein n=1 Tax=Tectimicrobiota bacterium TaxID=2528274 RepID=A0A932G1H2_UNCTE|nr:thioredoxin domain-containing protein [Candidatus Tectomicrobia bacterium]